MKRPRYPRPFLGTIATIWLVVFASCTWWPAESLVSDERLNGAQTLAAFYPFKERLRDHAVTVLDRSGDQLGLATRVTGDEWVCKASDVVNHGRLHVGMPSGGRRRVVVVGVDEISDVAMLRLEESSGRKGRFQKSGWANHAPYEGAWVSCLQGLDAVNVGVVSGRARPILKPRAMLGIFLKPSDNREGAVIDEVIKKGAADRARLKPDDRILVINEDPIRDYRHLQKTVSLLQPGVKIVLEYERDGRRKKKELALGDETMTEGEDRNLKMSGPVSSRRAGFEEAFQHDCPVEPTSMGGPVVDLNGRLVGVNIARSDRVTTYALTPRALRRAIQRIRSHQP